MLNKTMVLDFQWFYLDRVDLPWPIPRWKARARVEQSMENSVYLIVCTQIKQSYLYIKTT